MNNYNERKIKSYLKRHNIKVTIRKCKNNPEFPELENIAVYHYSITLTGKNGKEKFRYTTIHDKRPTVPEVIESLFSETFRLVETKEVFDFQRWWTAQDYGADVESLDKALDLFDIKRDKFDALYRSLGKRAFLKLFNL